MYIFFKIFIKSSWFKLFYVNSSANQIHKFFFFFFDSVQLKLVDNPIQTVLVEMGW